MQEHKYIVIVVDDEEDICTPIAEMISASGYQGLPVTSGQEALDLLSRQKNHIAGIVSDYKMPGMSGFDLRQKMIEQDFKEIPFILISGFIQKEDALSAVHLKVSAFLQKPVSPEKIIETLDHEFADRVASLDEQAEIEACFFEEAVDLLEELEPLLLSLEDHPTDQVTIDTIFRLVHTVKGGSGVLDDTEITDFLHVYEDLLSKIKRGETQASPEVVTVLLSSFDVANRLIQALKDDQAHDIDIKAEMTRLVDVTSAKKTSSGASTENLQAKQNTAEQAASGKKKDSIEVPTNMLDEFMGMSGEITVIRNMVNKLVRAIEKKLPGDEDVSLLSELLDEMHKINGSMQSQITELRKLPIEGLFRRLPRTVRDLARKLGKDVRLETEGEGLRIDTSLSQVLAGCLTHLVRNSVDHGVETKEQRLAAGKDEQGVVHLTCREDGENVYVTIKDDGGGINPDKIRQKAVSKGLYSEVEAAGLSDHQVMQLVFEAGFSTAEVITDVSGRGVGMDMVRSSVEALRGKIEVNSTLGTGTSFEIILPIPRSVVIINSLIVMTGDREFAVPQDSVSRLLRIDADEKDSIITRLEGGQVVTVDGRLLPLVDLHQVFMGSLSPSLECRESELNILLLHSDNAEFGLVVEAILDAEDMVVKSLHPGVESVGLYSGATFMGDGSVGLILNVDGLEPKSDLLISTADQQLAKAKVSVEATKQTESEGQDLLIFDLPCPGVFATPLASVYRLERFKVEQFRYSGEQVVVQYREKLMPIFDLAKALNLGSVKKGERGKQDDNEVAVVVAEANGKLVGMTIDGIQDVIRFSGVCDTALSNREGIVGGAIYENRTLNIVDLTWVAQQSMTRLSA
jgi:two-component system chemotaxis sensor kinase CheA